MPKHIRRESNERYLPSPLVSAPCVPPTRESLAADVLSICDTKKVTSFELLQRTNGKWINQMDARELMTARDALVSIQR